MPTPDRKPLSPEELQQNVPDELPAREAMSLVNPSFVTVHPPVGPDPVDPPIQDPGGIEGAPE
jgi:hypothetical protein